MNLSRCGKLSLAILFATLGTVHAGDVDELEPNDSLAFPQSIDGFFTLESDSLIASSTSIPHVSIRGFGNFSYDYYSFTVVNPGVVILDIDGGATGSVGAFDSELALWDSSGNLIAANNNAPSNSGGGGSGSDLDAFLEAEVPAGTYVAGVAQFDASPDPGGWSGQVILQGALYFLQVSVEHPLDPDGDGFFPPQDCDNDDGSIYPGRDDVLCNGIDENCNGLADDDRDVDRDQISVCEGDCDDSDSRNFPGNAEVCDLQDNNCDGVTDEGFDIDGDGLVECVDNCPDDYNPDQADFNQDGVGEACTPCDPTPRSRGYYHRQCLGAGLLTPGRKGRGIGPVGTTEPEFDALLPLTDPLLDAVGETLSCEGGMLAEPPHDACEQAKAEYTALLFNLTSSRLSGSCAVELPCGSGNLTDVLGAIADLISGGDGLDCRLAAECAALLNTTGGIAE